MTARELISWLKTLDPEAEVVAAVTSESQHGFRVISDPGTDDIDVYKENYPVILYAEEAEVRPPGTPETPKGTFTLTGPLGTTQPIPYDASADEFIELARSVGFGVTIGQEES